MTEPDHRTFSKLAERGNVIPVVRRVPADLLTPVAAYLRLQRRGQHSFLLESVEGGERIARYSFLGMNPYLRVRYRDGAAEVTGRSELVERAQPTDGLFELLRKLTRPYRPAEIPGLPPFTSGAVGYLAYDVVRHLERIPSRAGDDLKLPEAQFLFFSHLVVFDHLKHQMLLVANVFREPRAGLRRQYNQAVAELDVLEAALAETPRDTPTRRLSRRSGPTVHSNFERRAYFEAVRRAKRHIRAGDIYQVVLAQRFRVPVRAESFSVYRALRRVNPSPYMYFLDLGDCQIVGSSPEMLVKVQGRDAFYRPIAGTRPRGATEEEDRRLEQQLRASAKERAEHIMLVDLGRNDLGRVCEYGSVRVDELMAVERYSHVMHLVSSLRGRLRRGVDSFDALAACFPAGTVTGAPKVRAMQIIEELEPIRRGIYAGCICYLDFRGNLDSCIAIRTLVVKDGEAYAQAGGGIVADSRPEREYDETVNKARALLAAIELAEKGPE